MSQPDMKLELSRGSYAFDRGEGWSSEVEDTVAEDVPFWARPCEEPIQVALRLLLFDPILNIF